MAVYNRVYVSEELRILRHWHKTYDIYERVCIYFANVGDAVARRRCRMLETLCDISGICHVPDESATTNLTL